MRKSTVQKRKACLIKNFILVVTTQSNFCSCNKAGSFFFNRINVRFISAGIKSDSLQNFFLCYIRSNEKLEIVLAQYVEGVHNQSLLKEYGVIFKVVEFRTGNLSSAVKIDDIKLFTKLNVVFWFKVELAGCTNLFYFKVFCVELSNRCIRVNHVRKLSCCFFELFFNFLAFSFNTGYFLFDCFSGFNKLCACISIKFLLHCLGIFISFLLQALQFSNKCSSFVIKFNNDICISSHVAVDDVLFYSFKIVFYKFIVKHFNPRFSGCPKIYLFYIILNCYV